MVLTAHAGHVDAGKSTLMGHFLYALGQVSEKTIKKYEREAQKIGKSSFAYAWVLDETGEERSRYLQLLFLIACSSISWV
jgi:elongation factor 1 alpha-like protein